MHEPTRCSQADHPPPAGRRTAHLDTFSADVLRGLACRRKRIPSLWLYDQRGSELFEQITSLDEYYPTRVEIALLERLLPELHALTGPIGRVIDLGIGSGRKTRLLLSALPDVRECVAVDVAEPFMRNALRVLKEDFPQVAMHAHVADLRHLRPAPHGKSVSPREMPTLAFFPGSTIGNFRPHAMVQLLRSIGRFDGVGHHLLIGVDMTQDSARLLPAYQDGQGVTAGFNLNLLERINRELQGDFSPGLFQHEARYDRRRGRMEMHLLSRHPHEVVVAGRCFAFAAGESIHTENAYKPTFARFAGWARMAGWSVMRSWSEGRDEGYAVLLLRFDGHRAGRRERQGLHHHPGLS